MSDLYFVFVLFLRGLLKSVLVQFRYFEINAMHLSAKYLLVNGSFGWLLLHIKDLT